MASSVSDDPAGETHVMLSLYVVTTKLVKSDIIQLAAVVFNVDTGEVSKEFGRCIDISSCKDNDPKIDVTSLSRLPSQISTPPDQSSTTLSEALVEFTNWVNTQCGSKQAKHTLSSSRLVVWGNGATGDIQWLRNAFLTSNVPEPLGMANIRCFLTIVKECLRVRKRDHSGTTHSEHLPKNYAIHDCKAQIACLVKATKDLYGSTSDSNKPVVDSAKLASSTSSTSRITVSSQELGIEHAPKRQRIGPPPYILKRGSELISSYP